MSPVTSNGIRVLRNGGWEESGREASLEEICNILLGGIYGRAGSG
jgi:hypothetical protein